MIVFPNSKINLGLDIIEKREDGYHNISSAFYPINWCDVLEILENKNWKTGQEKIRIQISGIPIQGSTSDNLINKIFSKLNVGLNCPPVNVYLHKVIPMGAGLGGGSSDAAFFLKGLIKKFDFKISESDQLKLLSELGSDCAFFYKNVPALAEGKGDQLSPIELDLNGKFISVIYPNVHSNTAEAYKGVKPSSPKKNIKEILSMPITTWKDHLKNDFEFSLFNKFPKIAEYKKKLYQQGALYASMTGSGSAIYGIFEKENPELEIVQGDLIWQGKL